LIFFADTIRHSFLGFRRFTLYYYCHRDIVFRCRRCPPLLPLTPPIFAADFATPLFSLAFSSAQRRALRAAFSPGARRYAAAANAIASGYSAPFSTRC
jgi:hypothetical protein